MDDIEHDRDEDYMKKYCESLKEHAIKIINFEKKKIISLTNKELESYANEENCNICKKIFENKYVYGKKLVSDHYQFTGKYRRTAHNM